MEEEFVGEDRGECDLELDLRADETEVGDFTRELAVRDLEALDDFDDCDWPAFPDTEKRLRLTGGLEVDVAADPVPSFIERVRFVQIGVGRAFFMNRPLTESYLGCAARSDRSPFLIDKRLRLPIRPTAIRARHRPE